MKRKNILIRVFTDIAVVLLCVMLVSPYNHTPSTSAEADNLEGVYTKTFTISAYYSPLPCQEKYTTGTYKGDIRLNGNGTNGADGTPVYPGMVAAPKSYDFGTKMYIPGVGTVAIHDRGGAIVEHSGENGVYDRLDIWMGYGDIGLQRALNWGKRNVDVTVYGVNAAIAEEITLANYSSSEAYPQECTYEEREPEIYDATEHIPEPTVPKIEDELGIELSDTLSTYLQIGSQGAAVSSLQSELTQLNYYKGGITGNFDELTQHAVYKFQQSQGIIADSTELGAGVFGPKTRDRLNEIITSRNYTNIVIATATKEKTPDVAIAQEPVIEEVVEEPIIASAVVEEVTDVATVGSKYLVSEMDYGQVSGDVYKLQEFLLAQGYFEGGLTTNYFGPVTQSALITFQLDNQIITAETDKGAGRVGPSTLTLINSYY